LTALGERRKVLPGIRIRFENLGCLSGRDVSGITLHFEEKIPGPTYLVDG